MGNVTQMRCVTFKAMIVNVIQAFTIVVPFVCLILTSQAAERVARPVGAIRMACILAMVLVAIWLATWVISNAKELVLYVLRVRVL